jgi:hypothetical protein
LANIFTKAWDSYKDHLHKFSWILEMSNYPSGFNSSERQEKKLIPDEKYCIWLGNIFAHPGFINVGRSLRIFGGSAEQRKWWLLCNHKGRVSNSKFWN